MHQYPRATISNILTDLYTCLRIETMQLLLHGTSIVTVFVDIKIHFKIHTFPLRYGICLGPSKYSLQGEEVINCSVYSSSDSFVPISAIRFKYLFGSEWR